MWKFSGFVCFAMLTAVLASGSTPAGYRLATITSVQKLEMAEPAYGGGDNPSDAPLQTQVYAYDVAVKTDCGRYVAHYESPYDYLPSAFAPEHELPVRLEKDTMQFDLGYRQVQMRITKHKKDTNCSAQ